MKSKYVQHSTGSKRATKKEAVYIIILSYALRPIVRPHIFDDLFDSLIAVRHRLSLQFHILQGLLQKRVLVRPLNVGVVENGPCAQMSLSQHVLAHVEC